MNTLMSSEIREISESVHYRPTVSIILPFEPKMGAKAELTQQLKFAVDKVEREIKQNYNNELSDLVLRKLRAIIKSLNYSTYKKSIAIYVSPLFEKVLYLDIPVREKIIVNGSFEIRDLFGSNTISAVKNLTCPLIVVPEDAHFTSIKKIGLACDLKKVADTAPIKEIKKMVKDFGAQLHVIHVNTMGEHQYGEEIIEQSGILQEMLDELHPAYHFINITDVDRGLIDFTDKHNLDLLIVVPKKHNLIEQLFHKSHTRKMVSHTHVPLLAIHE